MSTGSPIATIAQLPLYLRGLRLLTDRGVRYDVKDLTHEISQAMGLTQNWPLAGYGGFSSRGFQIKALLDADPKKIGSIVGGQSVLHIDQLERVVGAGVTSISIELQILALYEQRKLANSSALANPA